jgi:hypothetical protein
MADLPIGYGLTNWGQLKIAQATPEDGKTGHLAPTSLPDGTNFITE